MSKYITPAEITPEIEGILPAAYDSEKVTPVLRNEQWLAEVPEDAGMISAPLAGDICVLWQMQISKEHGLYLTRKLLNEWGVSIEQMQADALENTKPVISMYSPEAKMLAVTNEDTCNGAGVIIKPEARRTLVSVLHGSVLLIPSSRHEWVAVPEDEFDAEDLKQMHLSVQAGPEFGEDVWLSDNIYRIKADDPDTIEVAA